MPSIGPPPPQVGQQITSPWFSGSHPITQLFGTLEQVLVMGVQINQPHTGIDVAMPIGTALTTPAHAVVSGVGIDSVGNNFVRLNMDNGDQVLLLHLQDMAVKVGQDLAPGTLLGHSGNSGLSTGPHLHFEVDKGGMPQNPFYFLISSDLFGGTGTPSSNNSGSNCGPLDIPCQLAAIGQSVANVNSFFGHLANPGHDPCTPPNEEVGILRVIDAVSCPSNWWKVGFVTIGMGLIGLGIFIYFIKEEAPVIKDVAETTAIVAA